MLHCLNTSGTRFVMTDGGLVVEVVEYGVGDVVGGSVVVVGSDSKFSNVRN